MPSDDAVATDSGDDAAAMAGDSVATDPGAAVATVSSRRPRGRPPRIRLEDVVDAAAAIGLAELTFKAVAADLGVATTAIYHYVSDREALLDLVAEELSKRSASHDAGSGDWFEWAHEAAVQLRNMLRAAPGLAERALANMHTTPGILERYETSLELAVKTGFDEQAAYWATRALFEFVQGWVLREERRAQAWGSADAYRKKLLQSTADRKRELPVLRRVVRSSRGGRAEETRFTFTLDCLLSGLRDTLPAAPAAGAAATDRSR